MKQYTTVLMIVLFISIIFLIFRVTYESFVAAPVAPVAPVITAIPDNVQTTMQNIYSSIPLMDLKLVNTLKTSIKNIITQRPDVILALNDVLSDPLIHKTLVEILFVLKER